MTDIPRDDSRRDAQDGDIRTDAGTAASEDETSTTDTGSASENIAESGNNSGDLRPAPEVGDAERAASEESRRIAAAQDNEV